MMINLGPNRSRGWSKQIFSIIYFENKIKYGYKSEYRTALFHCLFFCFVGAKREKQKVNLNKNFSQKIEIPDFHVIFVRDSILRESINWPGRTEHIHVCRINTTTTYRIYIIAYITVCVFSYNTTVERKIPVTVKLIEDAQRMANGIM